MKINSPAGFVKDLSAVRSGRTTNSPTWRLGLLSELEVMGLLTLLLVRESRRPTRTSPTGELVFVGNQDRSLRNRQYIGEGVKQVAPASATLRFNGPKYDQIGRWRD